MFYELCEHITHTVVVEYKMWVLFFQLGKIERVSHFCPNLKNIPASLILDESHYQGISVDT